LWWQWSSRPNSPEMRKHSSAPVVLHATSSGRLPWTRLSRVRETWGLVTAKFLSDAAWFFYLFWLPKYLYDARGFDIKAVGAFAWIPYAAAGVGCVVGGWLSSHLLTREI